MLVFENFLGVAVQLANFYPCISSYISSTHKRGKSSEKNGLLQGKNSYMNIFENQINAKTSIHIKLAAFQNVSIQSLYAVPKLLTIIQPTIIPMPD